MLMIGVIWGHAINAYHLSDYLCWIHTFFRTYDMPFFMLISGIFLSVSMQKYELKKLLINKFTTLLVPVLLWSLIRNQRIFLDTYYFIPAVFYSSVIVIITNMLISSMIIRTATYSLPIILLHCIDNRFYNLAYLYPFFLTGYLFFDTKLHVKQIGTCMICKNRGGIRLLQYIDIAIIALWTFMLCFWSSSYTPWRTGFNILNNHNLWIIILYRFTLAMIGIIVMKRIFDKLYDLSISSFICKIGSKTLGIYFIQGIVVETLFNNGMNVLIYKYQIDQYYILPFMCYVIAPMIAYLTCMFSLYIIKYIM